MVGKQKKDRAEILIEQIELLLIPTDKKLNLINNMQSEISKIEINHLYQNIDELKKQMKDGFIGVYERLDISNGNVLKNTEFRIKAEKLPESVEHLGLQFNDLYSKTMRGYLRIEIRTKILWGLFGVFGTALISIITAVIIFKITS